MTKNELTKELAVSQNLCLSTAVLAVDGIVRVIKETLAKGEPVIIRGFGAFQPVDCKERQVHDFQTGRQITLPAHKSAKLRVSKELVKLLNAEAGKEANV